MFTTLRKFTVIFLALLQLIAPLVHAHSGEKIQDRGLHVPGLEMYGVEQGLLISQAVSHDPSSGRIDSRPIAKLSPSLAVDGIMVGVDAGMKDKKLNGLAELDPSHYLLQQLPAFNPALSPFDNNFTPQAAQFISCLFIPSLSPRAPPAQ